MTLDDDKKVWLSDSIYPLLSKFSYPHFAAIPPDREPPETQKAAWKSKKRTATRKEHPRAGEALKTQPSYPYYPTTRKASGRCQRDIVIRPQPSSFIFSVRATMSSNLVEGLSPPVAQRRELRYCAEKERVPRAHVLCASFDFSRTHLNHPPDVP